MAAPLFGAAIGGIAGGLAAGIGSYLNNKKLASAYEEYADDIRNAAKEYSGTKAHKQMKQEGAAEALRMGNAFGNKNQVNTSPNKMQNALSNMNNVNSNVQSLHNEGDNLGRQNKAAELNSKYNAATAKAQQALNQAGINYQVNNQLMQGGMNAAAGLVNTYNQLKGSDERLKKGINNESNLPEADIEDSLRQLETVNYQYKDPNIEGCDGDTHTGFTAQSAEKTPLFKDAVQTGEDGYKRIDEWKLMESLTAGIAQMQREIDELERSK